MPTRETAINYAQNNYDLFLSNLKELVRIPSISTSSENLDGIRSAAQFVEKLLHSIGVTDTKIIETAGHPVVYGHYKANKENAPTVLVYGHYDVQPADPIALWDTPPFEPSFRGDYLYGRGASDMKGQIIAGMSAVDAMIRSGDAPLNIKFIYEGEEEIGSPSLPAFLEKNASLLKSDVVLNPDAGMIAPDVPTIVYGLRGLAYFELRVSGPNHDLHSGLFGGIVRNPAQVLAGLISGMKDKDGVIQLEGFYGDVLELSESERKELSRLPISDSDLLEQTGTTELWGEKNFTSNERTGARPTLDVNGLYSGFIGEGSKTVIPSWAMAKISMRLVPNQDPDKVHQQLLHYIEKNIPSSVTWELKRHAGGKPFIANINHPGVLALSDALESVWNTKPVFKREGGSIPIVSEMKKSIGVDSVLTGFGLPNDNIHSPNERLHLPTWKKGIVALIHFLYNYAGEK
jgi:acetylornithine deacetylase/succinyl-diaminopimelate desuccinylase-like protein